MATAYLQSTPAWTPLRSTWTSNGFGLELQLGAPLASSSSSKPKLRLPTLGTPPPVCRFDPFADDDEPPKLRSSHTHVENIAPPALSRGRTPTPLSISVPTVIGRRARAPSFSAGSGVGRRSVSVSMSSVSSVPTLTLPSPAPSLSRPRLQHQHQAAPMQPPQPVVPGAPSPFMARHYPTPDARSRLLARTLLNRINVVGRPRSACSTPSTNGYESESGARAYVPSRLSECVVVA